MSNLPNIRIRRFIDSGQTDGTAKTVKQLAEAFEEGNEWAVSFGEADDSSAFFQGTDGKWYVSGMRFAVEPASPRVIASLLSEREECSKCGHITMTVAVQCEKCKAVGTLVRITKKRARQLAKDGA